MTQHEQIVAAYESYLAENEKFTAKGVKAAAARKEITAEKEALVQALATAAK